MPRGEGDSVLLVGGWAGILAGVFVVAGLITFLLSPTFVTAPGSSLEQQLVEFPEASTSLTVAFGLFTVGFLLFLPFLAALYRSLREPPRVFAPIVLGSSVLAVVLLLIGPQGTLGALNLFSVLYDVTAVSDRPVVVATYTAVVSLFGSGLISGLLIVGLAFVAFGNVMRGSPDYQEGFAWLSAGLGIIIVLLPLLILGLVGILLLAVLALVLGWKIYSLSRAV